MGGFSGEYGVRYTRMPEEPSPMHRLIIPGGPMNFLRKPMSTGLPIILIQTESGAAIPSEPSNCSSQFIPHRRQPISDPLKNPEKDRHANQSRKSKQQPILDIRLKMNWSPLFGVTAGFHGLHHFIGAPESLN